MTKATTRAGTKVSTKPKTSAKTKASAKTKPRKMGKAGKIGVMAPDFRLRDGNGKVRRLYPYLPGFSAEVVDGIQRLIQRSQYKRRLPLIAKVSQRTIDRDFRYARDWGV